MVFSTLSLMAQSVISVHSGVLHFTEGDVFTDNHAVNQKLGVFPDLKEGSVLRTELGRAEVLLTPGVFLRVGENSSVKMIDNRLSDTRVEVLSGKVVVESDDLMKENAVTIIYKGYQAHVRKPAVFEIETDPEQLKVYHGEAEVESDGNLAVVKAGRLMPFSAALAQEKFDARNTGDALTRWSQVRSEYVAVANVSGAKTLRDSGATWDSSGWFYNPYYSMYTYIPLNGVYWNPYGFGFFSPFTVYQVYAPYYYGGGGGVGRVFSGRTASAGNSGSTGSSGLPTFGRTASAGGGSPSFGSGVSAGSPSFGGGGGPSFGGASAGGSHGASGGRSR